MKINHEIRASREDMHWVLKEMKALGDYDPFPDYNGQAIFFGGSITGEQKIRNMYVAPKPRLEESGRVFYLGKICLPKDARNIEIGDIRDLDLRAAKQRLRKVESRGTAVMGKESYTICSLQDLLSIGEDIDHFVPNPHTGKVVARIRGINYEIFRTNCF